MNWLSAQSSRVQSEFAALQRDQAADAELFLADLSFINHPLPAGRLRALFDLWQSVPSLLAFEIAVRFVKQSDLAAFTQLAAEALLTTEDAAAFADAREAEDPLEEHLCWLRARAYVNKLSTM